MKRKITKRDLVFFLLRVLSYFLLNLVVHWENNVAAFNAGMEKGRDFHLSINLEE